MHLRRIAPSAFAAVAFLLAAGPLAHHAAAASAAALTGKVTGPDGAPLEGVVVTANKFPSTITVSVVTQADGSYSFPADRLSPGAYYLTIRATGFELVGDGAAQVAPQQATAVDLKLKKAYDLAAQLTNAEWITSFPGTPAQKGLLINCVSCHTLERVARSTHNVDEWVTTLDRMYHYAQVSQPVKPQKRVGEPENMPKPEVMHRQAEYLATVNLSAGPEWNYDLKTFPRVTGRGTHVIITEYALPRPTIEPHDVILDKGRVWFSDFGEMYFGSLDPKTGKLTEYPLPTLKQGYPVGLLDLETDKKGNFWLGAMFQGALAKFDRDTKKFRMYSLPKESNDDVAQINMVTTRSDVDGKVWTNNVGHGDIYRVDVATGAMEHFEPYKNLPDDAPQAHRPHAIYDLKADSQNNLFFTDFAGRWIGRIDAKTGKTSFYATPSDGSRPRRGRMDSQDRFWFAEYGANRVAMLDTKSGAFQEWEMVTPWTAPYDVTWDKNGELWTSGMTTDRVVRLDPKTGNIIEYPMPSDTNVRRVFVDNSTTPVTFWAGSNHAATVVKVEPLD